MPRFVGALAALVALAAGILARIDPLVCLERAAIAFAVGWTVGLVGKIVFEAVQRKPSPEEATAADDESVA